MSSEHCAPGIRGGERYLLLGYPGESRIALIGISNTPITLVALVLKRGSAGKRVICGLVPRLADGDCALHPDKPSTYQ
jgi:hypothetical protein